MEPLVLQKRAAVIERMRFVTTQVELLRQAGETRAARAASTASQALLQCMEEILQCSREMDQRHFAVTQAAVGRARRQPFSGQPMLTHEAMRRLVPSRTRAVGRAGTRKGTPRQKRAAK